MNTEILNVRKLEAHINNILLIELIELIPLLQTRVMCRNINLQCSLINGLDKKDKIRKHRTKLERIVNWTLALVSPKTPSTWPFNLFQRNGSLSWKADTVLKVLKVFLADITQKFDDIIIPLGCSATKKFPLFFYYNVERCQGIVCSSIYSSFPNVTYYILHSWRPQINQTLQTMLSENII